MTEEKETEAQESFASLLAQQEGVSGAIQRGQKLKGKIIVINNDDVFVDIGAKQDGVMDHHEFIDAAGNDTAEIGQTVEAFVIDVSSQGVRLSRSMSGSGVAALEEAQASGIPVEGRIISACKGGYNVDILGKRAFCPGSQMEIFPEGVDPAGLSARFLITKIENHGRNIVVSRRALLERERRESLDKLMASMKPGDIISGKVTRLAPFGAFVEIAPFVEGMVHLSELSWARINSADEVVQPGDELAVKVLKIDTDEKGRTRIALSAKAAMEDPWSTISERFHVGDIVSGKVRRLAPFGAFVEIAPGVEGLAHVSELSWEKRVTHPDQLLEPGQTVSVKIKEIKPEDKKISLSLKEAAGDPWLEAAEKYKSGTTVAGTVENKSPYGFFILLEPGVTGLLPLSEIKNSPKAQELDKLKPGQQINLLVQKLDQSARRISLKPLDTEKPIEAEEKTWSDRAAEPEAAMGLMAQALQKALAKRNSEK